MWRDARLRRRADVLRRRGADGQARRRRSSIDPVELRLLNAMAPGDTLPTGQQITGSLPVAEVIRAAAALEPPAPEELPRDPLRLPGGAGNTTRGEGVRRGVGFAVGFKNIGFSEGFDDYCAARVRLFDDGSAEVYCAAAEVGQGVTERDAPGRAHRARHRRRRSSRRTRPRASTRPARRRRRGRRGWWPAPCATPAAPRSRSARRAAAARSTSSASTATCRTTPLDPGTGQITGDRAHVALRGLRDARRRRGRRRARPDAGRLDRRRAGRRQGDQPAARSRARSRAAPRRASASR